MITYNADKVGIIMDITERRRALITQLAAARMEKGMTQAQLARAIGTQRSNICRLVNIPLPLNTLTVTN